MDAEKQAREIYQFVETACGELGYEAAEEFEKTGTYWDDDAVKVMTKMKKNGVRDLGGAYGDHIYNQSGTVSDLMGDKVYDAAGGDNEKQKQILDALEKMYGGFANWAAAIRISREFVK